jgi:class 3 adenylate cyclase
VMDHFDLLREGVAAHHGGLVKTIGDAIMAVFTDPADAVAATLDILERFHAYNAIHAEHPLLLKMGMHSGACIAVTLNDRLDYFGSVVNIAARLEGQSEGGDLVLSETVARDPAVAALLIERGAQITPFTAYLKGFAEPFSLRRVALVAAPALVAAIPALIAV